MRYRILYAVAFWNPHDTFRCREEKAEPVDPTLGRNRDDKGLCAFLQSPRHAGQEDRLRTPMPFL